MSDEGDEEVMDQEESYGGGGDEGDSDGGPIHPCFAWCIGLVCIVVSCYFIFQNEGSYVHAMKMIEEVEGAIVNLCDGECKSCNFNSVKEHLSGDERALKDGDLIWVSCPVQGLKSLADAKDNIKAEPTFPAEISDALKDGSGALPTAFWRWDYAMKQGTWSPKGIPSGDLKGIAESESDRAAYCKSEKFVGKIYNDGTCTSSVSVSNPPRRRSTPRRRRAAVLPADATCQHGMKHNSLCCSSGCSSCGGADCSKNCGTGIDQEGCSKMCCTSQITKFCDVQGAPCKIRAVTPEPTPPPTKPTTPTPTAPPRRRRAGPQPDPTCSTGKQDEGSAKELCCPTKCVSCGQTGCGDSPGSSGECCRSGIKKSNARMCTHHPPPCLMKADACSVTDGSGASSKYPCICGEAVCSTDPAGQKCTASTNTCQAAQMLMQEDVGAEFVSLVEVNESSSQGYRHVRALREVDSFLGAGKKTVPRRRREPPRRRRSTTCQVAECTYAEGWGASLSKEGPIAFEFTAKGGGKTQVNQWERVPLADKYDAVYVSPPKNVIETGWPTTNGGTYMVSGLSLGTKTSAVKLPSASEEKSLADALFPASTSYKETVKLEARSSATDLSMGVEKGSKDFSGRSKTTKVFDRSAVVWDYSTSQVNLGDADCKAGCICTASAQSVGKVRLCMEQSNVQTLTVIAGVTKKGNEWKLVPDQRLKDSESKSATGVGYNPYRVFPNMNKTPAKILEDEKTTVGNVTNILRFVLPLILWLGFYCCLTPIVWVIDQVGDNLDDIPCVGGMLGGIAECIETLATIIICVVSCCTGLMCSLFIMAFAWLWFRPWKGCLFLGISLLICGGLVYLANSQKGQPRADGKPSRRQRASQSAPAAPQTQMQEIQPQQMQVQCPAGSGPGDQIQIQAPNGQMVPITVPDDVEEGQMFLVNV